MLTTKQVLSRRWYVPDDAVFGTGAMVYAGEDPNGAPFVCDCNEIVNLNLWDGDPYVLAEHIASLHNAWLKVFADMQRSLREADDVE